MPSTSMHGGASASVPRPPITNVTTTWPFLTLDDTALDQLAKVFTFLDALDTQGHAKAKEIREEFMHRMDYLNEYGGTVSETDARRRFKVTLYKDFADMSFAVYWAYLNPETGEYTRWMNGGLIWHGGPNDPFCVSLTPQWWGIHT